MPEELCPDDLHNVRIIANAALIIRKLDASTMKLERTLYIVWDSIVNACAATRALLASTKYVLLIGFTDRLSRNGTSC